MTIITAKPAVQRSMRKPKRRDVTLKPLKISALRSSWSAYWHVPSYPVRSLRETPVERSTTSNRFLPSGTTMKRWGSLALYDRS